MLVKTSAVLTTAFTAALIRASLDGFARLASHRLVSRSDAAAQLSGLEGWRTYERDLLLGLASALDEQSPASFGVKSAWSRDAFSARSVSLDTLTTALTSLREVLEESLPLEARAHIQPYFEAARVELKRPASTQESAIGADDRFAAIAFAHVTALIDYDEERALAIVLDEIDARRMSATDALEHVIVPAQRELGRRWHRGELGIAEEHFATGVTRRAIERILTRAPRSERNEWTVVVTSVEGDAHDLGVSIVSAFFELAGWKSICLGANTPVDDVVRIVERFDADVVALGATIDIQREAAAQTIAALRKARPNQFIVVGGGAFQTPPHAWQRVGADAFASSPRDAVEVARRLVTD
ncbi:MAG: cobalamin-dependent protein [Planctomycetota bacterium]|nr:cobalamin-dependent protein [Planctomycetota bacterium]